MQSFLISACLLGHKVRYNGSDTATGHALLAQWHSEGRVVGVCPEVAGGFAVPRPPAEITTASGGAKVLQCVTSALLQQRGLKVFSEHQIDDTQAFLNTLDNQ